VEGPRRDASKGPRGAEDKGQEPADTAFLRFFATLNERQARLCAAERALALGRGGITRLAQVMGLSVKTIRSHSTRSRVWKVRLQAWADELQRPITVCHLPPGTSKWNNVERRLCSAISNHMRNPGTCYRGARSCDVGIRC
jgi:hypothetical protein